ncbi:Alpha/Beta hydrolase protein [Aspergillus caelatus]|uniref:Alpha/Beta hydrolase protein n=2 Tax=Aspergillus subgen. Circumdati TaxID=2720871 RepID=A0A5N6ZZN8_9EURO|nr:Alpha/Beta hydrolase protein [Aspergillus caelatus]KAE8363074.1 Alpha/Beta hydrolase protein [Aspergillus caelatus]KAE8415773.1 Alpha/Beta hydrolase protein [Aspergillus pseudocaelatus]
MVAITDHNVVYAGDKKIHYLAAGPVDGPLVLFIHGWPGTAITWKAQIDAFASVGFRAIAPDMPGYGQSTARRVVDDYCQEAIVEGMMALLADTGRDAAIWVGHDWGAGVTSSVATQHPEVVKALVNLSVPFHTIERGWQGFLPFVNRELYPADEYEFGQWDYMKNWEENFEKTVEWFDRDVAGFCKASLQPSMPPSSRFAQLTANVRKAGGWMGGAPKPPSVDMTGPPVLPAEVFDSFVQDMEKTGFWPGSAYYLHHARNAEYNGKRDGKLDQPVLFIHDARDVVCDTITSGLVEPMRENCSNLTEVTIDAGHFAQYEKPEEVQAAIFRFIVEELPTEWPGFRTAGYTKKKKSAL